MMWFLQILFIGEAMQIFQTLNASDARPPLPSFSASSGETHRKLLYWLCFGFWALLTKLMVVYTVCSHIHVLTDVP